MSTDAPYADLTPDVILTALEGRGFECNGSILALASYENRVYQIGTADGFVVAKFYRPGRWSNEGILEEHEFALELAGRDIPVVAPLVLDGRTLHEHDNYRFAVYERRGGRWPELDTTEDRVWMGRFLARLHAVGAVRRFQVRASLSRHELGAKSVEELLDSDWIPAHLVDNYRSTTQQLLEAVDVCFEQVGHYREIRIHGDCHRGNVLWTDKGPHFVDLDDCVNGPAVQDLWLFLSGTRDEMAGQLGDLLEGYGQFFDFDFRELQLIEALRALRLLHYTAWITRRWSDPAFPRAFPWLGEARYWEQHVQSLMEQRAALDEPPLAVSV
ncbi:MAG TPA: serine/threonine protein kinase [Gammaproteobacteria bacterium]|nr:serine/threonine protein kinase [Gammaproteobacteria bacterium]